MGAKKGELTYHERTTAEKRDDAEKKKAQRFVIWDFLLLLSKVDPGLFFRTCQ